MDRKALRERVTATLPSSRPTTTPTRWMCHSRSTAMATELLIKACFVVARGKHGQLAEPLLEAALA